MSKKRHYLSKKEGKVVTSFVKELKDKLGDEIVAIRLFGSKVRGDAKKDSDMDIFILVKERTLEVTDITGEITITCGLRFI